MKHTPGPWHVEPEQYSEGRREVICAAGEIIAVVYPVRMDEWDDSYGDFLEWGEGEDRHYDDDGTCGLTERDKADSRLLAAAPELYEALDEVTTQLARLVYDGDPIPECIIKARKAMEKAGGPQYV